MPTASPARGVAQQVDVEPSLIFAHLHVVDTVPTCGPGELSSAVLRAPQVAAMFVAVHRHRVHPAHAARPIVDWTVSPVRRIT